MIRMELGKNSYNIELQRGNLKRAGELLNLNRKVLILTDEGVPRQYAEEIARNVLKEIGYDNKEQYWGYREDDYLGGYDMYSSSKACCEILINSFRNSFFNTDEYVDYDYVDKIDFPEDFNIKITIDSTMELFIRSLKSTFRRIKSLIL